MAFVKLLKIDVDGVPVEHTEGADELLLGSVVISGGPIISASGVNMNNLDIVSIQDLNFVDPTTATINQTAGLLTIDNIMAKDRENVMGPSGTVNFPMINDVPQDVDNFQLPTVSGMPTATPLIGGEGHMVWDAVNDTAWFWNGTQWVSVDPNAAETIANTYTAAQNLTQAEVVYISAANTVDKALADNTNKSRAIGVAKTSVLAAAPVYVVSEGVTDGFTGLAAGGRYFLDPITAGAVTNTAPNGNGQTIVQVGYAKNTTMMHIHIEQMGRRS